MGSEELDPYDPISDGADEGPWDLESEEFGSEEFGLFDSISDNADDIGAD